MSLLTTSNPKTQKGVKKGYLTAIQHFAPSKLSGTNVCQFASPECIRFCLNKAGRGGIIKKGETTNVIQEARKARTLMFLNHRDLYKARLVKEIEAHVRKAAKLDLKPCIRLNGTSDIDWLDAFPTLFWRFQDVQFYDYTKDYERMVRSLTKEFHPDNYHLTFSRSELNDAETTEILWRKGNVAIVFNSVPGSYSGYPVLNGDNDDLRFLDTPGCVVGLTAKGKLARFESSFKVEA